MTTSSEGSTTWRVRVDGAGSSGAIERALEWSSRWELIESSFGSIADHGHDWDDDPAEWVHKQRFSDPRVVG
jgi:hypothetical protein